MPIGNFSICRRLGMMLFCGHLGVYQYLSGTAVPVVVSLMMPKDVGFPRPAIGLPADSFRHGEAY
jgi:hypothetical protein